MCPLPNSLSRPFAQELDPDIWGGKDGEFSLNGVTEEQLGGMRRELASVHYDNDKNKSGAEVRKMEVALPAVGEVKYRTGVGGTETKVEAENWQPACSRDSMAAHFTRVRYAPARARRGAGAAPRQRPASTIGANNRLQTADARAGWQQPTLAWCATNFLLLRERVISFSCASEASAPASYFSCARFARVRSLVRQQSPSPALASLASLACARFARVRSLRSLGLA
jgi:hypothetical protein